MKEKNSKQITFGTYAIIVTIVFLVLLVGILAGMLIQKNQDEKVTNTTENIVSNVEKENETEKEDNKTNEIKDNKDDNKTDEKTPEIKGEKLIQFTTEFYSIEEVAKVSKEFEKVKNFVDYEYDLDGDEVKDKITIKKINKKDYSDDGKEEYDVSYYNIYLNGKEFSKELHDLHTIYIVDLNKQDKNLELIVETPPFGDGVSYCYEIYQKNGNEMKTIGNEYLMAEKMKVNQQGKFLGRNSIEESFSPYIVSEYHELSTKGKIKTIQTLVKNISTINFEITNTEVGYEGDVRFTSNKKEIGDYDKYTKIEKGTKFKILETSFRYNGCRAIKIELSNGKVGYLYTVVSV